MNTNLEEAINEFNSFHNEEEKIFRRNEWFRGYREDNDKRVILVILAEYCPSNKDEITHIHSECNYWGSDSFNEWLEKYELHMEWWNACIVYIYYKKDA